MLTSLKNFSGTIQWLATLSSLVVGFAFAFCFQIQSSTAQNRSDFKFREFDREMVHSPRELARDLNYLFLNDKKNPFADIDPEKLKKLRELGTEFLENLSDEEKKQAQEFAEKFMKDKGLNSPEGKLLMDSLGVSPEMQSELAEEFGENDFADLEQFRDLFKDESRSSSGQSKSSSGNSGQNENPKSVPGNSRLPENSGARPKIADKSKPGDSRPGNDTAGRSKPGIVDPNDIPDDLFESLPDELNRSKRKSARRGQLSKNANGISDGKTSRDPKSASAIPGADIEKAMRELSESGQLPQNALNQPSLDAPNRGKRGQGKSGLEPKEKGLGGGGTDQERGLAGKDGDGELSEQEIKLLKELDSDKSMAEFLAELKNKRSSKKKLSTKKLSTSPGSNPQGIVGDAQSKQGLDETFKSWIQMEAIKKRIREFQQRGPSDFQRRSLESAFKKGFKGLGDSLGDTLGEGTKEGLSKSEFRDKFDRVLFDAAADSADFEQGDGEDSDGIGGAVGSTLDGILDRVSKAAKERQQRDRERQRKGTAQNGGDSQVPLGSVSNGDPFGDDPFGLDGLSSEGFGTDALGNAADMLENIAALPAFELQNILIFASLAVAVVLLLYFLLRNYKGGSSTSAARKFGRSFQAAKIRSPRDLVEAVDYFIVQKFGTRARWWNARHAQEMLCAGSPGYSAKISDLLKDYVRARYMRSDLTLSAQQQLSYKKTLQELSKEVPVEQTLADPNQDES